MRCRFSLENWWRFSGWQSCCTACENELHWPAKNFGRLVTKLSALPSHNLLKNSVMAIFDKRQATKGEEGILYNQLHHGSRDGDSQMKTTEMLLRSLNGRNSKFSSNLACSRRKAMISTHKVYPRVVRQNVYGRTNKQMSPHCVRVKPSLGVK